LDARYHYGFPYRVFPTSDTLLEGGKRGATLLTLVVDGMLHFSHQEALLQEALLQEIFIEGRLASK
jgi:hypothetical protein